MKTPNPTSFTLNQHGLAVAEVHRNLPPSALYEHAIRYEKDASIAENGALVAYSGVKTGRSPKDKRVVRIRFQKRCLVGPGEYPVDERTPSRSTASARSITSTHATGSTVSTASQAGTRNIASKCASSARGLITRSSCTRCSSGRRKRN